MVTLTRISTPTRGKDDCHLFRWDIITRQNNTDGEKSAEREREKKRERISRDDKGTESTLDQF